jgi:phosphinothricin acetyltransferase
MAAEPVRIRLATAADLPAINDIYNYYVPRSACTYQLEAETAEGRAAWFAEHGPRHPVTVAVDPDGTVVGWGSLSKFRERAAYDRTVENGVYIRHDQHRRGIGRVILLDLIARAEAIGHHTIIAGIDAEQHGSVALHAACGFEQVALMKEVGFKFDRWLHVIFMQRMLEGKATP